MGMGGAGVAVTTDALATYWNPAGLAMTQTVDIRIVGGGQAIDRLGIADAINDLENFNPNDTSPANIAKAQDIANRINQPGANTSFNGAAGLYVKGHFGEHAFGFNISDVPTGGGFVSTPVTVTVNGTTVQPHRRDDSSSAGSPASRVLLCLRLCRQDILDRIHAKILQGAAYNGTQNLQGGQDIKLSDSLGKATISTTYGIDVGAIYRPSSWLRFGVVAKDLNQPEFDSPDGTQDQARASGTRRHGAQSLLLADVVGRCRRHIEQDVGAWGEESGAELGGGADDSDGISCPSALVGSRTCRTPARRSLPRRDSV